MNSKEYTLKPGADKELKTFFKGIVSYLRSMHSTVDLVYEGNNIGKLNYFKVVENKMSKFQSKAYTQAYEA